MNHPDQARQHETQLEIAAPKDIVWKAISEAAEIQRWFAPQAEVEPGPGGQIRLVWPDLFEWPQTIEVWEEGRRLVTRYDSPVEDGAGGRVPLFIEYQLTGEGGHTRLRLVHHGFGPGADFDEEFDGISHGWPIELRSLRLYCEEHAGTERRLAHVMRPFEGDVDDVWERLTGPDGLNCGASIDRLAEGEAFTIAGFEGTAMHCHRSRATGHDFTGRVTNRGDALLRVMAGVCGGTKHVGLSLASYGRPDGEVAETQARFEALIDAVLGGVAAKA